MLPCTVQTLWWHANYIEIDAVYWKLPTYPKAAYGAFPLFSEEYGLFSIGGSDTNGCIGDIYNLSFDPSRWREGVYTLIN